MFAKILIPLELTIEYERFIKTLTSEKKMGFQQIHLVNVLPVENPTDAELLEYLEKGACEQYKDFLTQNGYEVFLHTVCGRFSEEINKIAEENGIDLIVTGSHSESLIYELILDPRSDDLIRNSHYPILSFSFQMYKEKKAVQSPATGENLFHNILFPTDFSDNAQFVLDTTLKTIVSKTRGCVTLLHVQEHKRIHPHLEHQLEEFNRLDEERLLRIRTELLETGATEVNLKIVYGHAAMAILETINAIHPTLVLLGNQGRGQIHELFIGSVAHHVVRKSTVPVLLVPWNEKTQSSK